MTNNIQHNNIQHNTTVVLIVSCAVLAVVSAGIDLMIEPTATGDLVAWVFVLLLAIAGYLFGRITWSLRDEGQSDEQQSAAQRYVNGDIDSELELEEELEEELELE